MKRFLILALTSLLVLSLFSCGGNRSGADTGTDGVTEVPTETDVETSENEYLYEYEPGFGGAVIVSTRLLAKNLVVPNELGGSPVVGIAERVFIGIGETESAVIPEGVTFIGASAFEGEDNLREVTLPSTLEEIGERAFRDTPWLDSLDEEFTVVGKGILLKYAGEGGDVAVPEGVRFLTDAFSGADGVTSVALPEGLEKIGSRAFSGSASISSFAFPSTLSYIGDSAFSFCRSLKEITIPGSVKETGEFLFSRCPVLEKVTFEPGIENVKLGTFFNCAALREVVLPDTVKTIEGSVFEGCTALERVVIPASVEEIAPSAFDEGTQVTVVTEEGTYADIFCAERGINVENDKLAGAQ